MATFTAIRNKKQTAGAMLGVLSYVVHDKKTMLDGAWLVTGSNCVPRSSYLEMMTTKQQFKKTDGRQFYHFVQSFSENDDLTPQEINAIGLELAQRAFPGYEVVIATHIDTNHLHNHLVVNSVSCENGKKLHQNRDTLLAHRQLNDEICMAHGLRVLEELEKYPKKKRMKPGEYQAGLRADSWKLDLIQAINEALEYATDRESFIENMEYEGYEVTWTDTRRHITFTCPNGRKCRDSSLHDETFLKENLEALFAYRQAVGFHPGSVESDEGWMGELADGLIQLGRSMERMDDMPPLPVPPTWTDSKQRRREALKKLAMGQKLSSADQYYGPTM
ncbi:MAG: relaxase/mobilization nuclease domain-containing protein [Oscillibacter sp.]|nr:relaxase/mobilization nuclease domain-containing protein [Oscillibacter sp.]